MKTTLIVRTFLIVTFVGGVLGDDGEDDTSTNKTNCPGGYVCPTGMCIPSRWLCDGDNDCGDMSDEENCPSTTSTQCTGFTCNNDGECLPQNWQCDGEPDCDEGEDEAGCPCQGFQCPNNGRCIPSGWTCDGDNDCGDLSDETEESCPCTEGETRCPSLPDQRTPGNCIPPEYICDSDDIWDCPDGSDQANCTNQSESEEGGSNSPSPVGVKSQGRGRALGRGIQRSGAWKQYSTSRLTKAYEVEAYEQKYAEKRQSSYYNSRSPKNK